MSNRLGGKQGTAYTGTNANQPPNMFFDTEDPTSFTTQNVELGDMWLNKTTKNVFQLVSLANPGITGRTGLVAEWVLLTNSGGTVTDLAGDTGLATPTAGVITIAGGTNINTAATGSTVTVNLDNSISLAGTLTVPALTNGVVKTNGAGLFSASNGTNGQLLIGGGTAPQWANLTSNGGTIAVTPGANSLNIDTTGGGTGVNAGSLVFLAQKTASGDTEIEFDTEITSSYNDYFFILSNMTPTVANQAIICQLSTDGGGTYITTGYINNEASITNGICFFHGGDVVPVGSSTCVTSTLINVTSGVGYVQNSSCYGSLVNVSIPGFAFDLGTGAYDTPNTLVSAVRFLYEDGSAFDGHIKIYGFAVTPIPFTGGSLVFLAKKTATADTEIEFTTEITTAYNNYLLLYDNIVNGDLAQDMLAQISIDGGSTYITTGYFVNDTVPAADGMALANSGTLTETVNAARSGSTTISNLTSGVGFLSTESEYIIIDPLGMTTPITGGQSLGYYGTANQNVNALRVVMDDGSAFDGTISLYGYGETAITPTPPVSGALVLIETQTAVADTSLDFTTGITAAYNNYQFIFDSLQPTVANLAFIVQLSTDGGMSWITTGYRSSAPFTNGLVVVNGDPNLIPVTSFINGSSIVTNVTDGDDYISNVTQAGTIYDPAGPTIAVGGGIGVYETMGTVANAFRFMYQDGSVFNGTVSLYAYVR